MICDKKMPIKNIYIFFYNFLLFSDNCSEVETIIWEDHIELNCSFVILLMGMLYTF